VRLRTGLARAGSSDIVYRKTSADMDHAPRRNACWLTVIKELQSKKSGSREARAAPGKNWHLPRLAAV